MIANRVLPELFGRGEEDVFDQIDTPAGRAALTAAVGTKGYIQVQLDFTIGASLTHRLPVEIVEKQVKAALASGAKALTGGKRPEGKGQFYPPTVLVDVTEDMEAIYDETFGPTLPIMKVASEEEAIQRANQELERLLPRDGQR